MKIEKIPTDKLIPYARNAKRHDAAQVSKLAGSIKEFGFNNPVLIDKDNGIIAGHGRVMAAQQLALAEVPCIRLGHLTDNQRRAYILADNRLAEINSGWDEELLKLEVSNIDWGDIKGLSVDDFEFGEIEFGEDEKEGEKSDADAEPQIDKAEELRAKWGVEPGQLWELGEHRLLCGDSTKKEDVERVMEGKVSDILLTDPPYGMRLDADFSKMPRGGKTYAPVIGDDADFDFEPIFSLWKCKRMAVWGGGWFYQTLPKGGSWLVWDKQPQHTVAGPQNHFEECWVWPHRKRIIIRHLWTGFTAKEAGQDRVHPTQKPIAVMVELAKFMGEWDTCADPFSGSGTTIIACEQLGRKCRAIEISPAYVAVALQRWADATGKTPRKL